MKNNDHLHLHDFGIISQHSISALTAAAFLLLFSAMGIFVRQGTHAATPEIESGLSAANNTICMDDWQGRAVNNNPVDIFTCNGTSAQQWSVNSNHTITIKGMCMDVYQSNQANGTKVELFTCNGGNNQLWNLNSNDQIVSLQSGKCLDIPNGSTANNTQLQMWTCNGNAQQVWFASSFGTVTPAPTPPPTPQPTPPPTVQNTPPPGGGGGGGGGGGSGGGGGGTGGGGGGGSTGGSGGGGGGGTTFTTDAPVAGPQTPTGFQAQASANAVVILSWAPAPAAVTYNIERSQDQNNWTLVASSLNSSSFSDSTTEFGVHYYYRLSAYDSAGNQSGYALADLTTPGFTSNATAGSASTFTSDDGLATVTVPSGAIGEDTVNCAVASNTTKVSPNSKQRLAMGPYQLVCKDAAGNAITGFQAALSWTFNAKNKLKGLKSPQVFSADQNGGLTAVSGASYSTKDSSVKFSSTTANSVLLLATVQPGVPWNAIAIILLVLGVMAGVAVIIIKRSRRENYQQYLREKYYNL